MFQLYYARAVSVVLRIDSQPPKNLFHFTFLFMSYLSLRFFNKVSICSGSIAFPTKATATLGIVNRVS